MTEPTRIIAKVSGEGAQIRLRMFHEMESGQRKDAAGKTVPAWYIQDIQVALNGKSVLSIDSGPGLAKNPFVYFKLKSAKAGDKISVSWKDSKGASRTDEGLVV